MASISAARARWTVREACERKQVSLDTPIEQLEAEFAEKSATARNPADLPFDQLANYIVETHHGFLWRELPCLHAMAERVARVHGPHTPSLIEVFNVFFHLEGYGDTES